ncbi:MAG: NifB/NifX family molybdenum-iron cluster-binding protein [Candidatus Izemoplasmatales bacterium]|jgi:predicted Fe-Mo cluster-binding NifX family protein
MKIAIPIQIVKETPVMCTVFARAGKFLIYDSETQKSEFLDNPAKTAAGGAGIVAAQTLIDAHVDGVIVPQCGENAMNVLSAAGIPVFQNVSLNIPDNLKAFHSGTLLVLMNAHAGFHSHS